MFCLILEIEKAKEYVFFDILIQNYFSLLFIIIIINIIFILIYLYKYLNI